MPEVVNAAHVEREGDKVSYEGIEHLLFHVHRDQLPSELDQHLNALVIEDTHRIGLRELLEKALSQIILELMHLGDVHKLEFQIT